MAGILTRHWRPNATAWREDVAGTLADRAVDMTLGKRYRIATCWRDNCNSSRRLA
jgi:hypothetical protein